MISNCAGIDLIEQNKFLQTLPNRNNFALSNCSKNVQKFIQMALKWLFSEKLAKIA